MNAVDTDVFALIAPDCVRRGLVKDVLAAFASAGLSPVAWQLAEVGSREVDRMHEQVMARSTEVYRFRCLDLLFGLGPSLLLRLRDQDPGRGDPHQRAVRCKGASRNPAHGTIRHDLRAINVVLSLLHTSDSPADSRRESELIAAKDAWLPAQELPGFTGVLTAPHPERRGFRDVLAGVRARVIAVLWDDLDADGRALAGDLAGCGGLGDAGAGARVAELLARRHPLADVLRAPMDPTGDLRQIDLVARRLSGWGIDMDPWERTVLGTSLYFTPTW